MPERCQTPAACVAFPSEHPCPCAPSDKQIQQGLLCWEWGELRGEVVTLDVVFLAIRFSNFEKNSKEEKKKNSRSGCWPELGWGDLKVRGRPHKGSQMVIDSKGWWRCDVLCWAAEGSLQLFLLVS